jgi:hypothetical protein
MKGAGFAAGIGLMPGVELIFALVAVWYEGCGCANGSCVVFKGQLFGRSLAGWLPPPPLYLPLFSSGPPVTLQLH